MKVYPFILDSTLLGQGLSSLSATLNDRELDNRNHDQTVSETPFSSNEVWTPKFAADGEMLE